VKGGGVEKYWTDTEVYRCKGGNQQLAQHLARAVGEDHIRLQCPATSISVNDSSVRVTCADGTVLEGDDVVLAVPPSVWDKIKMEPALPEVLKPQMGTAVKYLAAIKGRFWQGANLSPAAHTDGNISLTWEGTDAQPGEEGAELTGFSGGPAAEACRRVPAEGRDAAYSALIEQLYPGFAMNFVKSRFMDWPSQPLTMAAYSFPAPGQMMAMGRILREGIGRLHFAGEHTCYKFVGYMEGGLNSGASLARRIAERDGVAKPLPPAGKPANADEKK
jgi:monoamine oxidase